MKSTFRDPRQLAQEALAAWQGAPAVPMAGVDYNDHVAAQEAEIAAQAQADMQYAQGAQPAPAPVAVDPASVSSMAPPPAPEMTPQQQLAAEAYRTWTSASEPAGPPAPPTQQAPAPMPEVAPSAPSVGQQAPARQAPGGGGQARRPTLLDEQNVMAAETQDAAQQARINADVSTDKLASLTEMSGEEKSAQLQRTAEMYQRQQEEMEDAGWRADEERRVKTAVADDVAGQYKKLNDEIAATQIADRRTTGQRVMGALAMIFAGAADGQTAAGGGTPRAVENTMGLINEAVERDLAIQRANLDNKRNAAAAKFSELGVARSAIKDVDAQEAAARAALLDKYAVGLEGIKAQGMGEQATTVSAIAAEQIRQQAAMLNAQTKEQSAAKESDRQFQLRVQEERDRKAAAAAAARGKQRAPMVAELLAKEQQGTINVDELAALNKLRSGKLDVAKAERELASPGGGKPLSEYDTKVNAGLAPLAGKDTALTRIENMVSGKKSEDIDVPYYGTSRGSSTWAPNILTPTSVRQYESDVKGLAQAYIRIVSGAGIKDGEAQAEIESHGVYDRDEKVAAEGLKWLVSAIRGADKHGVLNASAGDEYGARAR